MDQPSPQVADWLERVLSRTRDHAVVLLDRDGDIVAWLGAAERLFGYSAAQALGQPFAMLFVPEDRQLALHAQELDVARSIGRSEDDRWHLRKDGNRFWGSGVLESVVADDGALLGYCKVLRDRTDVSTRLQALQNVVDAQQAEQDSRADAAARLLHELRNAVGPVLNAVRVLQRSDEEATRKQACDLLDRQVSVMKRLLDDGLDAWFKDAAAAAGPATVRFEPVVLQDALRLAAQAVMPSATERRQDLRVILPAPAIVLEADPARLHQMVVNLLGNAVKYTSQDGRISLTATVEGTMAVVRVEDDGSGIAPEVLPHVFELFTREERSASGVEGLGVGLAVVKEYAGLHGGSVEARSPGIGQGTIVALRLPLQRPASATPEAT